MAVLNLKQEVSSGHLHGHPTHTVEHLAPQLDFNCQWYSLRDWVSDFLLAPKQWISLDGIVFRAVPFEAGVL